MSKEFYSTQFAQNITRDFPLSPCSSVFGHSEDARLSHRGAWADYKESKSLIAKMAILISSINGVAIGLGGSCLDQLILESQGKDPKILMKKMGNINMRRVMVPRHSDGVFYDGPVAIHNDDIHAPGNIDLRLLTDDESLINTIASKARMMLIDRVEQEVTPSVPPKRYKWDLFYREAWDRIIPKERKKLRKMSRIDNRPLSLLRYIFSTDFIGIPSEINLFDTVKYKASQVELESLNIVQSKKDSLRSAQRCFNIDALIGKLSMNIPLVAKESILSQLETMEVSIELPVLPEKIQISAEALSYFENAIDAGNIPIMDQWVEVVIRSLRKSLTLGVPIYDDISLSETKRLMDKMVGEGQIHSDTVLIKNMRELEVCAEFDSERTQEMIDRLGLRAVLQSSWKQYEKIESPLIDIGHMHNLLFPCSVN